MLRDAELAGRSVTLYCFNEKAEAGALRRLATLADAADRADTGATGDGDHGAGRWQAFVERLVDPPGWVDLLPICRSSLVTGRSMGLKYVAPLAGFRWEDAEAGGEQSMTWYHDAVHHPDPGCAHRQSSAGADLQPQRRRSDPGPARLARTLRAVTPPNLGLDGHNRR